MDELDEYGIPGDLEAHARKYIGPFRNTVGAFVKQFNAIDWLARAAQSEPSKHRVRWISEVEEAKRQYRQLLPLTNAVFVSLRSIAEAVDRGVAIQAAEDYWIVHFDPQCGQVETLEDILGSPLRSQLVGALHEIVLNDIVSVHFFREAVDWYRRGHFLCGIDESGNRVVW